MTIARIVTLASLLALASAAGAAMSKADYEMEKDRIEATFDAAKRRCAPQSGNAKDICIAEARGNQKVALAELEERLQGSPNARYHARIAKAGAEYEVARQKCEDRSGEAKELCLKEAKGALARNKADAVGNQSSR